MNSKKIWLSSPVLSGNEVDYITKAIESGWLTTQGSCIDNFEKTIQEYLQTKKEIVALNSGTSSIHMALLLLGVTSGDEVICPTFTFSASVNPILYQHATPIFVDSEKDTWNMNPIHLEEAIIARKKQGKNIKAIIVVNAYGVPAKWDVIQRIAQQHEIPIIEDAAPALGAKYNGLSCGTFGDFGIFSFNGNKIITTSSGGVLICNSLTEKEKAIFIASQAKDTNFNYTQLGYNYRMSNLLAAVGSAQMTTIEERLLARKKIFDTYVATFVHHHNITVHNPASTKCLPNYWLTNIMIEGRMKEVDELKKEICKEAKKKNIDIRHLWQPLHIQKMYNKYPYYGSAVSEDIYARGLSLPTNNNFSRNTISRIMELFH